MWILTSCNKPFSFSSPLIITLTTFFPLTVLKGARKKNGNYVKERERIYSPPEPVSSLVNILPTILPSSVSASHFTTDTFIVGAVHDRSCGNKYIL